MKYPKYMYIREVYKIIRSNNSYFKNFDEKNVL